MKKSEVKNYGENMIGLRLKTIAGITILLGIVLMFVQPKIVQSINLITLFHYRWVLFVLAGFPLLFWQKRWSFNIFISIGGMYILLNLVLLFVVLFLGIFMNDTSASAGEIMKGILKYVLNIVPFILYWIAAMWYVNKIKRVIEKAT